MSSKVSEDRAWRLLRQHGTREVNHSWFPQKLAFQDVQPKQGSPGAEVSRQDMQRVVTMPNRAGCVHTLRDQESSNSSAVVMNNTASMDLRARGHLGQLTIELSD